MSRINKAVIPAAGRGTRLRPLTDYLSKAMLPLGRKPVLQHIIEELQEAGITEIALVIRPEDQEVISYFNDWEQVECITDDSASGPAGALLHAEDFVDDDDFLVVFADAPVFGPERGDHLEEMMSMKKESGVEAVLSIYRIPASEAGSRGIVRLAGGHNGGNAGKPARIPEIIEKPSLQSNSDQWASTCRYLLGPSIFDAIRSVPADEDGELQLTTSVQYLIKEGKKAVGLPLPKRLERHDTGNFEGYFKAQKRWLTI